ncbi:MAG: hypothetical protein ABSB22_22385 [Thermodesulfobacteriota bacterium]
MYDSIVIEGKNKPTATFVFEHFVNDALSAASSKGMPVVRVVPETIVSESTVREDIEAAVTAVADDMIGALTRPLTAEEKSPKPRELEKPARIVFKGSLEEVNRFYYKRGWTDGLPIMPPTEDAVAEMLTGTDLPANHIVAELEPRRGKATIEKIAINAAMAGALPTYMPLLIAGVQALAANPSSGMMAASTGSWAPFWLINGPVSKDLQINSSFGALSPGNIANATIGRAMGLITKNIRGIRKQIEDMGVLGNPGKYSMVAAENEEFCPWEPMHVEHGFSKADSTITLTFPQSFQQMIPYGTDDKGILTTVVTSITQARMGLFALILTPANAKSLASKGWTKKKIKDYIVENARFTVDYYSQFGPGDRELFIGNGPADKGNSHSIFRITQRDPEPIQIYVLGGFGSWMGFLQGGPQPVIKKAELPANWNNLVAKYKNIVPSYVRY